MPKEKLKVSLNLFGSWSRCFLYHSNNPSLQSSIKFSLVATSREVGCCAMVLKLPDNIAYGGHRNIKISGDGLVALRLSMLGYNFVWPLQTILWFSFFFYMLIAVHTVEKTSHSAVLCRSNWLKEWFLYCRYLQLTTGEFNSKVKENHLLEM